MISVKNTNSGIEEPLINIGEDFQMVQSVDGNFEVSFTCFPSENNPGYELLRSETVMNISGYIFKVKQYSDSYYYKSVTATSIFFDLSKVQVRNLFSGTHSLINHLNFISSVTDWVFQIDEDIKNQINYIENFGQDNVISLIEKVKKYHQIEYIIMTGNVVRFSKQVGPDNDFQYRYKNNVNNVVLLEDTTNLYTFIRGFGADGLEVSYTSPNQSVFGTLEANEIRDDRFTDRDSLINYIKSSIVDVPKLTIQSEVPELTNRETGERVWLIYEPLNISMQTRILSQTKTYIDYNLITTSVVLGNSLEKNSVDLLVEQKQEIEDNKDYINDTNDKLNDSKEEYRSRFEVTDRNIVLQVERLDQSIATIDIKADNINLSVNNRITNEVAAIDIRANMIDLRVSDVDNRATSSINILNNNINLKVDKGGSITDINLSPGNATINADKINLNGAVFVNGMITGSTSIEVSTDVILGRGLRFSDFTALTTGGGNLTLEAFNSISYVATRHDFNTDNVFINGKRVLTTADL